MSMLSQLAAEIAAAAAAPLTQSQDDVSSAGGRSRAPGDRPVLALQPTNSSSSSASLAATGNAHDNCYSDDDSRDASSRSPCLSSTPPPFIAPDMLPLPPPMRLTVMSPREQQQCREQLMQAPGLYARCRMRHVFPKQSSEFSAQLLAGLVVKFELVFGYIGLHRHVSCYYTILEVDDIFCEIPLHNPLVSFREDGEEVWLVKPAGAPAWQVMNSRFQLKCMPYLLLGL